MSGSRRKPGPLGPFVDGYRAWLVGRGYSPSVVVRSLATLGHPGRWLQRNALAVDQLSAEAVTSPRMRSSPTSTASADYADQQAPRHLEKPAPAATPAAPSAA